MSLWDYHSCEDVTWEQLHALSLQWGSEGFEMVSFCLTRADEPKLYTAFFKRPVFVDEFEDFKNAIKPELAALDFMALQGEGGDPYAG